MDERPQGCGEAIVYYGAVGCAGVIVFILMGIIGFIFY